MVRNKYFALFVLTSLACMSFHGFLMGQRISGSATLRLHDDWEERIYSISQLEIFEDTTNCLVLEDIIQPRFQQQFKIRPGSSKKNFNTDYTYWVKLSIQKFPDSQRDWYMEFYDQSIDHIEAYTPLKSGSYFLTIMGDGLPFKNRLFAHKNFHVKIDNKQEGISNYYFKVNSSQKADIRIAVRSVNRFVHYALSEYFLYGVFYGMILIISLYNLLVFLAVREMKFLYYIFYLLSVGLYATSVDGIGFQYLWPDYPTINGWVNGVFSFSIVFWAVLFTFRFLNTKRKAPIFHKLLGLSLVVKLCMFLAGILIDEHYYDLSYVDTVPFLLIFGTGIYLLAKGNKAARFFVLAYGALFLGAVIKVLVNTAWVEHSTLGYYSLHLAFLVEMVLLSFALGDRIKIMKDVRDKALKRSLEQYKVNISLKEKVNQELESKVMERTSELEKKNRILVQYNEQLIEKDREIKRINSLLDKDNWKLKSAVKDSLRARLVNTNLTFNEFKIIFPDKSACSRYIESMKWEDQFTCRQCGKHKCSDGPKIFSKRCTKCGYIESVTAGTIFHGVRFPLEKAFYIAYSSVSEGKPYTLEEIGDLLDLNKNTVWAFRKKVTDLIQKKGLIHPKWEDIILEEQLEIKN
ncbi:7TMR-DISM family protein [Lunatibacter salilacus]|uniref:7TMR-DISM family protein n=1 Tax=Lunatibacter salilacus TaxID=2483804 RepID=UPI00131D2DFE|nr:7TM diverse intracellular signaling domain-containing protein [Lunatibacter salilacus]